jgi:ABC-type nickel/cobalt efflux system permease component RcnA
MKRYLPLPLFLAAGVLLAHPMGNFSVSHYSRIQVTGTGADIHYVLDLAEIPTFELLQEWGLTAASPQSDLDRMAARKAVDWVRRLRVASASRPLAAKLEHTSAVLDKGAGGMSILRVALDLSVAAPPGVLSFEDGNYPDRAGWKEIVVTAATGAVLDAASPSGADRSQELRAYPQDPLIAPPEDLRAQVRWHATAPVVSQVPATQSPAATPAAAKTEPAPAPANVQPGQNAPGMVVRGDYLSRLLRQGSLGWGTILIGLAVAFGLGSIHALSPGHGKTIVAAYLVGARGTAKHAAFLGGMVTFTHTISVFFLGLVTLFLSRYVLPETIYPVLGTISGLSIVWIGGTLFYKRYRKAFGHVHEHDHAHHHDHPHAHGALTHDHGDGHVHSHVPEGEITMTSLIALGASGGLVPCPSALVLLLSAVALDRVGLGLILLVAFSAGLASVLTAIGMTVLYAKTFLPDSQKTARSAAFRYLPVASAAIITCAGVLMTAVALGVIRPFAGI